MTTEEVYIMLIYLSVILALAWSLFNAWVVLKINIFEEDSETSSQNSETKTLVSNQQLEMIHNIGDKIQKGANAFLFQEYIIMLIFIVVFGIIVLLVVDIFG